MKDRPIDKKVKQKLNYARKNWPDNLDYFNKIAESSNFNKGLSKTEMLKQVKNMPFKQLPCYIFRNNGDLTFSKQNTEWGVTETGYSNGTAYADLDNDGDLDLFIGGRQVPGKYPFPARSYILENRTVNGVVKFVDVTKEVAPDLLNAGMVTSAFCTDFDNDGNLDILAPIIFLIWKS